MPQYTTALPRTFVPKIIQRTAALYQLKIIDEKQKTNIVACSKNALVSGDLTELVDYLDNLPYTHPMLEGLRDMIRSDPSVLITSKEEKKEN